MEAYQHDGILRFRIGWGKFSHGDNGAFSVFDINVFDPVVVFVVTFLHAMRHLQKDGLLDMAKGLFMGTWDQSMRQLPRSQAMGGELQP